MLRYAAFCRLFVHSACTLVFLSEQLCKPARQKRMFYFKVNEFSIICQFCMWHLNNKSNLVCDSAVRLSDSALSGVILQCQMLDEVDLWVKNRIRASPLLFMNRRLWPLQRYLLEGTSLNLLARARRSERLWSSSRCFSAKHQSLFCMNTKWRRLDQLHHQLHFSTFSLFYW